MRGVAVLGVVLGVVAYVVLGHLGARVFDRTVQCASRPCEVRP